MRVKAFLYAASREDDNDYHLIIGRAPNKPAKYMTAEISVPPPDGRRFFLLQARRGTQRLFRVFSVTACPATSYDFYDPPREIEIEGSLFGTQATPTADPPAQQRLHPHMPVVWEIHPGGTTG